MDKQIDFIQIYFKDEQLAELYPFVTPYRNETLTPFFENSVICDLVPQCTGDLVSVCSWALSRKRNGGMPEVLLKQKYGTTELKLEHILNCDADVIQLTPTGHNDIRRKLIQWHPNAAQALKTFDRFFKIPEEVKHAIYENHFVARREIYQEYVMTCLAPAIDFMKEHEEVFNMPSEYLAKKKRIAGNGVVNEALQKLGMTDWPMGVFLLERLFCSWIDKRNYNVSFV